MSSLFQHVETATVVLVNNGIYTESFLFTRGDELYAQTKTGYVRLLAQELTTYGSLRWKAIEGVKFHATHAGPRLGEAPAPIVSPEPVKQAKKPARKTPVKTRTPTLDKSGRQLSA